MRTIHTTIACCVFVLAAGPAALTQCSGGSSTASPKAPGSSGGSGSGGQSSGSSGGGSNGGSSSGSSGDDGGGSSGGSSNGGGDDGGGTTVTEGGTSSGGEGGGSSSGPSTPVPEGGAPSQPGMITCGSTTCDTTSQHCCESADGGTCGPLNGSCSGGAITLACKEAADCAPGSVCCQPLEYGPHSTSCMTSCPLGYFQVCRTDAECGNADAGAASEKCIVQTCYTSMAMTATGTVEACAYPGTGGGGNFPGGGVPAGGGGTVTYGPLPNCH
jgi:hypothetical protein